MAAKTEMKVDAPPERVFGVLVAAPRYADWLVGCQRVRRVEDGWPDPGAAFHHSFGVGPLRINDKTKVLALEQGSRLDLEARALPAGVAHVSLRVEPEGSGTKIVMEERAVRGPAARLQSPLLDLMVHLRNLESLRRLKRLLDSERAP